ncbi:MAG: hypothetical protein COS89_07570 [Deltaproteobacteria bacterium CG07_land_8_20_14_0_80_38_7]|nr:MAG: hypothetical protein COS89_07570 [Deltaproteobacteria bacterium CG07_land_8_20_14_0_80_38_7]
MALNKFTKILSSGLLVLFLCGCTTVFGPHDLRTKPTSVEAKTDNGNDLESCKLTHNVCQTMKEHEAYSNGYVSSGNEFELFLDGRAAQEAIMNEISLAKKYILMASYVLRGDETGKKFTEMMCSKANKGVEVYFMVDYFGLMHGGKENIERMNECGVHAQVFRKPVYYLFPLMYYYQKREHRKLLVVDGQVALVGSVSIGNKYGGWNNDDLPPWRETQVKVQGPIVNDLQLAFKKRWPMAEKTFEVELCRDCFESFADEDISHVVDHSFKWNEKRMHDSYITLIKNANHSLFLTYPYFLPSFYLVRELKRAAARGVDVRILLPDDNNVSVLDKASRTFYARLLKGGVKIYRYKQSVLHAKTMVIDGEISVIGSGNFDIRTFLHNLELNIVVANPELAKKMEKVYFDDLRYSKEVMLKDVQKRGGGKKLNDYLVKPFSFFL